jgi:hypothetical protein
MDDLPVHEVPLPANPWLQVQVKLPGVLTQAAFSLQVVAHSLISEIINNNNQCIFRTKNEDSPVHMTPSPVYPWLQAQVKLRRVLVQAAFSLQLSILVAHSSDVMYIIQHEINFSQTLVPKGQYLGGYEGGGDVSMLIIIVTQIQRLLYLSSGNIIKTNFLVTFLNT